MLIPAVCRSSEIIENVNKLRYSDKMLMYNGNITDGSFSIIKNDSVGMFQYAIVDSTDTLIGYMSYCIDYYSQSASDFSILSFQDASSLEISLAILQVIHTLKKQNLHRISFGAVQGNSAVAFYDKLVSKFDSPTTSIRKLRSIDVFKDREGNLHDTYVYEILFFNSISEKLHKVGVDSRTIFSSIITGNDTEKFYREEL